MRPTPIALLSSTGSGDQTGWSPVFFWPVVYIVLALLAYGPVRYGQWEALCASRVPNGVVALFNLWTIWWNADRLAHGLKGYFDAPIFWPEKGTFALSEPQPSTLAVAPLVWLFGVTPAFHAYFLVNAVLNGWFGYRLARAVGATPWSAGLAGAMVTWLPLIFLQPELVQYVPLWPAMWTWILLMRTEPAQLLRQSVWLGVAIATSFAACLHLGLLNLMVIVPASIILAASRGRWAELFRLGLGLVVAGCLLLPLIVPVASRLLVHAVERPSEVVFRLSASVNDWLTLPPTALTKCYFPANGGRPLHPGWLRILCALLTLSIFLSRRDNPGLDRSALGFVWMVALGAGIASFGPRISLGGICPWQLFSQLLPPLAWVRSPYRYAYLAQPALLVLAGIGLELLARCLGHLAAQSKRKVLALVASGIFAGLLWAEVPPSPCVLVPGPRLWAAPDWVEFLAKTPSDSAGVLLLDFPPPEKLLPHERTVRMMLWQARYRLPLVNGYSGYAPRSWEVRRELWTISPYSPGCLTDLERIGVKLLVRPPEFPPPPAEKIDGFQLKRIYRGKDGVEIWQLSTSREESIAPPSEPKPGDVS
ncbi:MAG: hypothetical protein NZ899_11615 [Thermoguttaceae bacterium]|nr:hypothetical protein [Thermoguttaceae bacterium]MDW8079514.1 hypothetical protein [Thermoguttaceae bacterium]